MPGAHPDVALESRLTWQGCGSTAFAAAAGLRPGGGAGPRPGGGVGPRWFAEWAALEAAGASGSPPGAPGAGAWGSLRSYFAAGGRGAYVLADPRLADGWLGEEGAPGYQSGIHALAELEDVSMIVVAAPLGARNRSLLLGLAARRPDLFFLLQAEGSGETVARRGAKANAGGASGATGASGSGLLHFHAANAAEVRGAVVAGALAGYLERTDFSGEERWSRQEPPRPPGLDRPDLERLRDWRRREGLRRALDRGTRWLLFEAHHPLVCGRVEREVRAFLHGLARAGLVEAARAGCDFDVRCEALPPPAPAAGGPGSALERSPGNGRGDVAGIIIRVRAALRALSGARPAGAGAEEAGLPAMEAVEAADGPGLEPAQGIETIVERRSNL